MVTYSTFSILVTTVLVHFHFRPATAEAIPYQPCPLLRAYYPAPTIDRSSDTIQSTVKEFTQIFDQLVQSGVSDDFGAITPNTTSFSVVVFTGEDGDAKDSTFFEYYYTAPEAQNNANVTADTVFPIGSLTQLFTVYAWLIEMGDEKWETPITQFLPELVAANISGASDIMVDWNEVTVGALAGQMAGIDRDSYSCSLSKLCSRKDFIKDFAGRPPLFLPDTTPILSNAAFQLLAFALESSSYAQPNKTGFADIIAAAILQPLNMTNSGLIDAGSMAQVFNQDLNASTVGEPAALSLLSTTADLASAGHSILSSRLLSPPTTRRWLQQPVADTSNLRNGLGRPWEIYRAGQYANSSILDVFTKTGSGIGYYSSYFGVAPDFNVGFAILAHDTIMSPDLNVIADIVSLALVQMQELAAQEASARFSGVYWGGNDTGSSAVLNTTDDGPGLMVSVLEESGVDIRAEIAAAMRLDSLDDLDFRLYPSNVAQGSLVQFVAVYQDKSAPVDEDTPTCITWMGVGALGQGMVDRVVFELDEAGMATGLQIPSKEARFEKQLN